MSKPREWTIKNDAEYDFHVVGPEIKRAEEVRVIEYSAYDLLVNACAELEGWAKDTGYFAGAIERVCNMAKESSAESSDE